MNKRAQVFLFARIFYNITFTYKLKHLRFQLTRNENCKEHLEHLGSLAKTELDLFSCFDRTEACDGRTDTGGYRTVAYTALAQRLAIKTAATSRLTLLYAAVRVRTGLLAEYVSAYKLVRPAASLRSGRKPEPHDAQAGGQCVESHLDSGSGIPQRETRNFPRRQHREPFHAPLQHRESVVRLQVRTPIYLIHLLVSIIFYSYNSNS